MTHVYKLEDAHLSEPSFLTIGVFDGLHRGHQYLVECLVDEAHRVGCKAVVLTFHPHPDIVIKGLEGRYYLTAPEQRADLLHSMGVDYVITHPFTEEVRRIRAVDFVDQLVKYLKARALWVGADFAMGYKREGDVAFLREQGAQKGFSVRVMDLVMHDHDGRAINSSMIRELLREGDVDAARVWLGRGYEVRGMVIKGEHRGRKIGFPTANIAVWEQQMIPANGVYAGWAVVDGERFMAMANVGTRPTFSGDDITVEAYLLDFDRDIYGKTIALTFETRLRDEKRFNGIDELVRQIAADIEMGRAYLSAQM